MHCGAFCGAIRFHAEDMIPCRSIGRAYAMRKKRNHAITEEREKYRWKVIS